MLKLTNNMMESRNIIMIEPQRIIMIEPQKMIIFFKTTKNYHYQVKVKNSNKLLIPPIKN
jgi:hypothetical protein